jgi:hypothetical protein
MGRACSVHESSKMYKNIASENKNRRNHLTELAMDDIMILKLIPHNKE